MKKVISLACATILIFSICSITLASDTNQSNEQKKAKMAAFVQELNETNTAQLEMVYTGDGSEDVDGLIAHTKSMIKIFEENKKEHEEVYTSKNAIRLP